ncbi:MAG TPA: hypothetical protein ENJ95_07145 [Bacteroidetes bacterium]|nr:hypothetical protein [Bacteroidota bacterium]
MKNKKLFFLTALFFAVQFLHAQNPDKAQLNKCLDMCKDSVSYFEAQSAMARKRLGKLLGKLKFDRTTYFGAEDAYLKKGMSQYYKDNKNMFALTEKTDSKVASFLSNYKNLYRYDKSLARWEYLKTYFEKEIAKPKTYMPRNAMLHRGSLPAEFRDKLKFDHLTNWSQQNMVASALAKYKGIGRVQTGPKVTSGNNFGLEPSFRTQIPYEEGSNEFLPEWVAASYPADGQYNFYLKEWIPGVGYFLFNRMPEVFFSPSKDYKTMVRWTDGQGNTILSEPKIELADNRLDFAIPTELLKKETLYKLDIVQLRTVGGKLFPLAEGAASDEDYFRKHFPELDPSPIAAEKVLHSIYFRTSKWDSFFAKAKEFQFEMDGATFSGDATLDEPLDDWELQGKGKLPPTIQFQSGYRRPGYADAVGSRELAYYLTFPEIEPVDTDDWTTQLNFEKKAEKEAENLKKRGREKYIKTPVEWVYGTARGKKNVRGKGGEDIVLDNGYTLHVLPEKLPFSLEQDVSTGFITQAHFENGNAPVFAGAKLHLHLLGPELASKQAALAKEEILKRRKERAHFFYLVNVREKKKNGETETRTEEDFLEVDKEHMPGKVKKLLGTDDLSPHLPANNYMLASKSMPGTKRRCSESKITAAAK